MPKKSPPPPPAPVSPSKCKWISGDARALIRAGLDPFCGKPAVSGRSYCPEHFKRSVERRREPVA